MPIQTSFLLIQGRSLGQRPAPLINKGAVNQVPRRPNKPCAYPNCPQLIEPGQRYCPTHKAQSQRVADTHRATAHQRGYTSTWRRARKRYLAACPLCVECKGQGRITAATVVDHIIPHQGDMELFWDEGNWQSMCSVCHSRKTAKFDGGYGRQS